jgi:hypothetical protein
MKTVPPVDRDAPWGAKIVRSPAATRGFGWAQAAGVRGPDEPEEAEPKPLRWKWVPSDQPGLIKRIRE